MKQYVIIGNGVAAAGCIEGIRSVGASLWFRKKSGLCTAGR